MVRYKILTTHCKLASQLIISFSLYNITGNAWKVDIDRESRNNGGYSHEQLAKYLRSYLSRNYPNVLWLVVVYDQVTGSRSHSVRGLFHFAFRHFGHNIVVGRILNPSAKTPPTNLKAKVDHLCGIETSKINRLLVGITSSHVLRFDAQEISKKLWDGLPTHSVNKVTLLVLEKGVNFDVSTNANAYAYGKRYSYFSTLVLATA